MNNEKRKSLYTYLVLLAIALLTMVWGQILSLQVETIRVWTVEDVVMMCLGIPFILLQSQAGLAELWQSSVSNKERIGVPFLIGFLFGAMDVLIVKVILHPESYQSLPPFLQPFPYSVFLYTSGAFEVEVFYRLIPLTVSLLLVKKWLRQEQHLTLLFWVVALLTSLREPIEQWQSGNLWFVWYACISGFLFNLLGVICLRKAGFMASMFLRLGHYLLWHIVLGMYVEFVELAK